MLNSEKLIAMILKSGLQKYRYKNSKRVTIDHNDDANKKGVVFGFNSKDDMTCGKGFVMSSTESVLDNSKYISHWTPNVYSWGGYTDDSKQYVRGHFEKNLVQENCFVIDVDAPDMRLDYLLYYAMADADIVPTAVVQTPKGYHLYFVLHTASYVSSANNYLSLRTAKSISYNLRAAYAEILPGVDVSCNHFGIFRMPNEDNLVHFDEKNTFEFEDLMEWSMSFSKEQKKKNGFAFKLPTKKNRTGRSKQVDSSWYKELLTTADIRGGKGYAGRNTAIFTAALACRSSGVDKSDCFDELDYFNSEILAKPVPNREVYKAVRSAYSGKYFGAHSDAISELSGLYLTDRAFKRTKSGRVPAEYWVKFAKPREERKRVHYSEWKKDLVDYINENTSWYKPYLDVPREKLIKDLGIPSSTLKDLLRQLKKDGSIYIQTKRGKGGFTKLATKKSMAYTLVQKRHSLFSHYKDVLGRYFPSSLTYTNTIANLKFNELRRSDQLILFGGEP